MNFRSVMALMVVFCAALNLAHAKDMRHRLGVGFKNNYGYDIPALATHYFPSRQLQLAFALGLDTQDEMARFALSAQANRIVYHESNMNFFMGGRLALLSQEVAGENDSGYELAAVVGAEFFLAGLENLGLTFETGLSVLSANQGLRFRTLGDSPLSAGMVFYF